MRRKNLGKVTEYVEPVNVPGVGPLFKHTFRGDNGEQLPDVIYTHGPELVLDHRTASTLRIIGERP